MYYMVLNGLQSHWEDQRRQLQAELSKNGSQSHTSEPLIFPWSGSWLQNYSTTATVRKLPFLESCCLYCWPRDKTAPAIIWISNMEIRHHDMHKMSDWELGFLLNMSWKTQRLLQLCLHLEVTKVQSQQKSWLPNLMQVYPIHQT